MTQETYVNLGLYMQETLLLHTAHRLMFIFSAWIKIPV